MRHLRPIGRGAPALKYDLLTAMGAFALSADPSEQKRILRLMTLITARYNWISDSLSVGQREIAQLWSCTERTVKRDMAVLRNRGWLVLRRQGARGRVSEYGIDLDRILTDTQGTWDAVGPDFAVRLGVPAASTTNVVSLPVTGPAPIPDKGDSTEWGVAQHLLREQDAGLYAAWVHALKREGRAGGRLVLRAPSRFHASYVLTHLAGRLLAVCRDIDPTLDSLDILC